MKPYPFAYTLCIVSMQSAFAATLYTGADISSITSGSTSDYLGGPPNHVAGKFTLSGETSEVKAVSFYGFYSGGANSLTVTTDVFDVAFFTDSGNGPGTLIDNLQTSLTAERFITESQIIGNNVFRYELDLSTSVALASGNYWISISRDNPTAPTGTGGNWFWAGDHTFGPALMSQSASQLVWAGTDNANPAFTLENTTFAVPEPQVFGMAAVAFASMLATRRRVTKPCL